MCGGGGGAKVDNSVSRRQASVARDLDNDYYQRFLPYERQLVSRATSKQVVRDSVNRSRNKAVQTFDASAGSANRQMAGFGMTMNADQKKAFDSQRNRDRNEVNMGAGDGARQSAANRYGQLQSSMMKVGRQSLDQGVSGISQAAGLENQRNIRNQELSAQNDAGMMGVFGTAAGMGAAFMISDRKKKKNISQRTDAQDMDDARSFANYDYDYKPGMSGGRGEQGRIGGMAQEMPASMSNGRQVDMGDATMVAFGAIRDMDKRLQQMEQALGYGYNGGEPA